MKIKIVYAIPGIDWAQHESWCAEVSILLRRIWVEPGDLFLVVSELDNEEDLLMIQMKYSVRYKEISAL